MRSACFGSALLCTVLLVACGGGGGSSPSAVPTSGPTQAATSPDPRPTGNGDSFAYAGTITQTFTDYGTPGPQVSPSATPLPTATPWVTTQTQTVTQNVSVKTGATFAGESGLSDFAIDETDAGQHATTTVTSNDYVSFVTDATRKNGEDVTLAGSTSTDSNGVSNQTIDGTGNGIFDELPEVPNAQWSNGAARTQTQDDPGGEQLTSTYAADGSYQESVTFPEGGTASVQENSDGSGVYTMPVAGCASQPSALTVSAPSGGNINVAYEIYVCVSFPEAGGFLLPTWYPQTPPVLASDSFVDDGPATVPSSCNVASSYDTGTIDEIVENSVRLDTVFGELETQTNASYVSSAYGVLCTTLSDDLQTYYDYSGQLDSLFYFSTTPVEDEKITETLGLSSATLAASSTTRRALANSGASRLDVFPSLDRVHALIAQARARHVYALFNRIHSRQVR